MKTKTKHTPGPWTASGCAIYQADQWTDGNNLGGRFIATTRPEDPDEMPSYEDLANAAFIAAAPELIATLKDLELRMTQTRLAHGIGKKKASDRIAFLLGQLESMGTIARSAIAKAEGRGE